MQSGPFGPWGTHAGSFAEVVLEQRLSAMEKQVRIVTDNFYQLSLRVAVLEARQERLEKDKS